MEDTSAMRGVPDSGYATGWYMVSWSHELGAGAVRPVRFLGRDLVLYRREDGAPAMLDAHCPHLGAHLGHGGKVDGDGIVCPFHAWRFDSTGVCTRVPYASRVPPRAAVGSYLLREHSGMILAFFGAASETPTYEIPVLEELSDPAYTPLQTAFIEVRTKPREVIENIADKAHFLPVHNTRVDDFQVTIDGPRATQRTVGKGRNLRGEKIDVVSVATYFGPAVQYTWLQWAFPMVLINAHVPIDEHRLMLRFGVAVKAGVGVTLPKEILEAAVAAARDGYFQDVAIWEHKSYRDRPVLADGDGPIGAIRKWYAGFFPESAQG